MTEKLDILNIHFKNGKIVTIDSVSEWEVNGDGKIHYLSVKQDYPKVRLIVKSLNMKEVNCITVE